MDIKPYIQRRSKVNGFYFYYYLHIKGGQGHGKKHLGGTYKFVIWYETPTDDDRNHMIAAEKYCEKYKIPFGHGDTLEEAYEDFQTKLELTPIQ